MEGSCSSGVCDRCHGCKKLIFGALLLLNAYVWPRWLGIDGWVTFVAVLMVIGGFLKLVKPSCGHCSAEPLVQKKAAKKVAKKRRR